MVVFTGLTFKSPSSAEMRGRKLALVYTASISLLMWRSSGDFFSSSRFDHWFGYSIRL